MQTLDAYLRAGQFLFLREPSRTDRPPDLSEHQRLRTAQWISTESILLDGPAEVNSQIILGKIAASAVNLLGLSHAACHNLEPRPDREPIALGAAEFETYQWFPGLPTFRRSMGLPSRSSTTMSIRPSLNRSPTATPLDTLCSVSAGPTCALASQKVPSC